MGVERDEFYVGRGVIYKGALGVRVKTKILAIDDYDGTIGVLSYGLGWTAEQMREEFGMDLEPSQRVLWVPPDDIDLDVKHYDFEVKKMGA